ncbi:ATP-binding protein [Sphaerisporangium dianthi]|uniref:ATP-binding protein n=1 Tax=Sphaerisporangium dianthi TaxID=1436120 RepID=A0ABV9CGY8_9ACTN
MALTSKNGHMAADRAKGQHRRGTVEQRVVPKGWDAAERATAEHIDQLEPTWAVWYGVGSRRFYAVATWPAPVPLMVEARSADELRDLMREAEVTSLTSRDIDPRPRVRWQPMNPGRTPKLTALSPQGASMIETPDGLRTVSWDLPHELAAVGKARHMANEVLIAWDLAHLADDVVLVIGELLGNAISHGAPPIRLSLWSTSGELSVRVTDHGPGTPRRLDLGLDADHGRGLPIVAALAGDYGVIPLADGPGKTVWARWKTRPAPSREARSTPERLIPRPRTPMDPAMPPPVTGNGHHPR